MKTTFEHEFEIGDKVVYRYQKSLLLLREGVITGISYREMQDPDTLIKKTLIVYRFDDGGKPENYVYEKYVARTFEELEEKMQEDYRRIVELQKGAYI